MNTIRITKVWTDDNSIYMETSDGRKASYAFSDWTRLAKATPEQRNDYILTYFGIHWPQLDEDLSFDGMFQDNGYTVANEDIVVYEKTDS